MARYDFNPCNVVDEKLNMFAFLQTLTPYAAGHQKQSKAGVTAEYNLEDTHATIKVDVNPGLPVSLWIGTQLAVLLCFILCIAYLMSFA